ncbi:MAG: hypothetical protein HOV80_16465 [Polyangiaceae bacterium]|nr:hypothetical protein [Polyangiaceae bacterium]
MRSSVALFRRAWDTSGSSIRFAQLAVLILVLVAGVARASSGSLFGPRLDRAPPLRGR